MRRALLLQVRITFTQPYAAERLIDGLLSGRHISAMFRPFSRRIPARNLAVPSPRQARLHGRVWSLSVFALAIFCKPALAANMAGAYQLSPSLPVSFLAPAAPILHLDASGIAPQNGTFPGNHVDAASPLTDTGAASGWSAAAVTLRTDDDLPVTAYAADDKAGPLEPGGSWKAGGAWSHPFGTDQVISYGIRRENNGQVTSNTFSDALAATEGRQLLLSGSFASSRADIPSQDGYSSQGSIAYTRHDGPWDSHLELSVASTDMGLAFDAVALLPRTARTDRTSIICNETERDGKGQTTIANQVVLGRDQAQAAMGVPDSRSGYAYDRLDLSRSDRLGGFALVTALRMQVARGSLFDSARLDAGTLGSVYMHGAGLAPLSEGMMIGQQMTGPATDMGKATGVQALDGTTMRGGLFLSYASLRQPSIAEATMPAESVATAGVSVECSLMPKMAVDVHLGWQRIRTAQPERAGPFGQAALSFSF